MLTAEAFLMGDGRRVAIHRLAEGDRPVVLCHASPGSGQFDPDPVATADRGITLIAPDRPGYGESDPLPADQWASVASAAEDLAEMLKRTVDRPVGVAGWSAGGRVALALAARHPDLVDRVAVIATPAPDDAVPWVPKEQKAGIEAMRGQPAEAVNEEFGGQMAGMAAVEPASDDALGLLGHSPADDDSALARPGARDRLAAMLREAFAQGAIGMATEIAGYTLRPWGFEPEQVTAKTLLIYGAADPLASPRHGRWWRSHLPNARLETVPDAGHLVVIPMWSRVLSFLAPSRRFGEPARF